MLVEETLFLTTSLSYQALTSAFQWNDYHNWGCMWRDWKRKTKIKMVFWWAYWWSDDNQNSLCIQLTSIFAFHQVPAKYNGFRWAFVQKSQPSSCWHVICVCIWFPRRTGFSTKSFTSGHFSVMHQILVEVDAEQAANELTGRDPPREKGEDAPEENGREDPAQGREQLGHVGYGGLDVLLHVFYILVIVQSGGGWRGGGKYGSRGYTRNLCSKAPWKVTWWVQSFF